jgi:hypothetical protein
VHFSSIFVSVDSNEVNEIPQSHQRKSAAGGRRAFDTFIQCVLYRIANEESRAIFETDQLWEAPLRVRQSGDLASGGMGAEGAGDEAESTDEQDQHDEGVEETGGPKIDTHVGEHSREDEEGSGDGKNPASGATAVPEQQADAEEQGDQSDSKGVGTEKAPKGADNADLVGEEVSAEAGHDDAEQEMAEAAGGATDVAEGAVFHGLSLTESSQGFFSGIQGLRRNEQSWSSSEATIKLMPLSS